MKYRYRPKKPVYKRGWFITILLLFAVTVSAYALKGEEIKAAYVSLKATTTVTTTAATTVPITTVSKTASTTADKSDKTEKTTDGETTSERPPIDPDKPMIALTFDDGPAFDYEGSNSTKRILKVLEKNNARATFFMVGNRVNDETKGLLKKEIKLGCQLGNHTYSHEHYNGDITAEDISKASKRIKKYCGQSPTIFRCPGGQLTKTIKEECKKEKMPLAFWSVDTLDWKTKDAENIYKRATKGAYDGAIILMHDIYPTTADAVEKIVPELIKQGYQLVTVSEMIEAKTGEKPKSGEQYEDCDTINNNT